MRCVDRLSPQPQLDFRLELVDSNLNSPLGHPFGILRHRVNASTRQRLSRLFDRLLTTASSGTKGAPTSLLQDFTLAAGPRPPHAPHLEGRAQLLCALGETRQGATTRPALPVAARHASPCISHRHHWARRSSGWMSRPCSRPRRQYQARSSSTSSSRSRAAAKAAIRPHAPAPTTTNSVSRSQFIDCLFLIGGREWTFRPARRSPSAAAHAVKAKQLNSRQTEIASPYIVAERLR
jgi:hypothetical protein